MLTLIISIAVMTSVTSKVDSHWVSHLLSSKRATKIESTQNITRKKDKTISHEFVSKSKARESSKLGIGSDGDPLIDPEFDKLLDQANKERLTINKQLDDGLYIDAYSDLIRFLKENPDLKGFLRDIYADCALMTGRYEEAYELLEPLVRRQGKETPSYLLAISIASSMLGETYKGQAEYCRDQASEGLRHRALVHDVEVDPQVANRKDPKSIAILSCIGLGTNWGQYYYLELALKMDPTNAMVGSELVTYYQLKNRKIDIKRISNFMLRNLPEDHPQRVDFEKTLTDSQ